MPTLEQACQLLTYHLHCLCARLKRNDETTTTFEPWTDRFQVELCPPMDSLQKEEAPFSIRDGSNENVKHISTSIPFNSILLEDAQVQQALRQCFKAFKGNTRVTTVHLYALPEPELEYALSHLHKLCSLEHVKLSDPTKSHSLSVDVVTTLLIKCRERKQQRRSALKSFESSARLAMHSQPSIERFGRAIQAHSDGLQSLSLALLPRTNPQHPTLSLDTLVAIFSNCDSVVATSPISSPGSRRD